MTPNEKAATFIGWDPTWRIPPEGHRLYGRSGEPMQRRDPEPDMSKPENYMRALEALSEVELSKDDDETFPLCFSMEHDSHYCATFSIRLWNTGGGINERPINVWGHGPTCGRAAVKVLAALYDAEHK